MKTLTLTAAALFATALSMPSMAAAAKNPATVAAPKKAPEILRRPHSLILDLPTGRVHLLGRWVETKRGFRMRGDISIRTPSGVVDLFDANLAVNRAPFGVMGSAAVPFPELGAFVRGADAEMPRASVALATGQMLGHLKIGGQKMKLNPDHYYFDFEYASGMSVSLGDATLSTPGAGGHMILDPLEPLFYLSGDLANMMSGGLISDAAMGFSAEGRLPFTLYRPIWDGEDLIEDYRMDAHILGQGEVQLGELPVVVGGSFAIDADADDDGTSIFEGDARDMAMGVNGHVAVGYSAAGMELSLEMAKASLLYDAREGDVGSIAFSGTMSDSPLKDTPFSFLQVQGQQLDVWGFFHGLEDFGIRIDTAALLYGYEVADLLVEFLPDGLAVEGTLSLPTLTASLRGEASDQGVSLTAAADFDFPLDGIDEVVETVTDGAICGWEDFACAGQVVTDATLCGSQFLRDAAVCGSSIVQDGTVCGYDTITDGARCGWQSVTDASICGSRIITDAMVCGSHAVQDATLCGSSIIQDAALCGTTILTDAATCGTRLVTDGAICGFEQVGNALGCAFGCFGNWENCCQQARTCQVVNTCQVANSCQIANTCNIANECSIPATCEIANACSVPASCTVVNECNVPNTCTIDTTCSRARTCEHRVEVPDGRLGNVFAHVEMNIDQLGFGGQVSAGFCDLDGNCTSLGSSALQRDLSFCLPVPGVGEVCHRL